MGKRRSKKLNVTSNDDDSSCTTSSISHEVLDSFKVLLCQNTEYFEWTKDCYWTNIAFLPPSVLYNLGCNSFVIVEGSSNRAVFIAEPLKSVKKGSIVLLNSMGFRDEETVTIYPSKKPCEAKEVFFTFESSQPREFFNDMLRNKLSNMLIWCGLKLQLVLFDVKYECVVSKIIPNKDSSEDENIDSVKHISSLFTTLELQETPVIHPFTTNHRTSLVVISDPSKPKFPLFNHVVGKNQQIKDIQNYIDVVFKSAVNNSHPHWLLLIGPNKTAKNMTLKAICNEYGIPSIKMNMFDYQNAVAKEILLKNATRSFLLLEKFDQFCSIKSKDHVSNLLMHLNQCCDDKVLILAALNSGSAFDKQLFSSFAVKEVKFTMPSAFDREEIIEKILTDKNIILTSSEIRHYAQLLQGMSSGDIFNIFKFDAAILSNIRSAATSESNCLNFCDIKAAIKKRKSSLLSSNFTANKVRWSDIGGMDATKEELLKELELLSMTEKLKRFNLSPSRGILLYGPPGCSKTMIAKALATESNHNFISKKASDIMNMYVGESEKAVTNLFLEARVRSPCIIFLDEIDAIAPSRNISSAVQKRVVNCLLNEMDGIEALKDVLVIAATNRPDIIDEALVRSGRIGKLIYVPLPDPKTRREIFRLTMRRRQVSDDIDFEELIEATQGYTGAEIVQLCNEAALQLLIEDPTSPVIRKEHFRLALLAVPPLTFKDTMHFYERFYSQHTIK